jgi:hypothetical protein
MRDHIELNRAQLAMLDDQNLRALRGVTRRLADETQRQAARYQRTSCDINREIKRRKRASKAMI